MGEADQDRTSFTSFIGCLNIHDCYWVCATHLEHIQKIVIVMFIEWQSAQVYAEDVFLFSCDADKHTSHDPIIMSLLYNFRLILNLKKHLYWRLNYMLNIDQFEHVIKLEKSEICECTTNAIFHLKPPCNISKWILILCYFNVQKRLFQDLYTKLRRLTWSSKRLLKDFKHPYNGRARHLNETTRQSGISTTTSFTMKQRTFYPWKECHQLAKTVMFESKNSWKGRGSHLDFCQVR